MFFESNAEYMLRTHIHICIAKKFIAECVLWNSNVATWDGRQSEHLMWYSSWSVYFHVFIRNRNIFLYSCGYNTHSQYTLFDSPSCRLLLCICVAFFSRLVVVRILKYKILVSSEGWNNFLLIYIHENESIFKSFKLGFLKILNSCN
jgi:hypothetical protein